MAIEKSLTYGDEVLEPPLDPSQFDIEIGSEEDIGEEPMNEEPRMHGANLAEIIDEDDLMQIGSDLMDRFSDDEQSRSDWLKTYVEGLDYLGFSMEDRDRPFKGASGVYHPVLTEAVVRFQSNAIIEIFPASGPVLTKILGPLTDEKQQLANRVKEELNYQLTENMCEFRSETEQLLFRLPLAGCVFKKTYYDPMLKRPASCMITAEDLVVDYGSSSLESAERVTHVMRKTKNEVKKMMRSGLYRKVDLPDPVEYKPDGKEKEDRIKGTEDIGQKDIRHTLLEFHVNYNLPGEFADEDEIADPYIITVDKSSGEVLSIYRNWEEGDPDRIREAYFTQYQYMPGLGFYGVGLIHLMGAIAKASTSILRQLIDAGTLSNLPGGLKTRGMRTKGGEDPIAPGEWRDVDVPGGSLKDNIMPLPYKEPSAVLAGLLNNLIEEGRRIGSIADVDIGSGNADAPVGTTLALMERSLKVMSAVHARLHASLKKELKLIAKVIFNYMPEHYEWDADQKFNRRQDFDGRVDVVPVSDPNAATQAQRIIQMQAVQQLVSSAPELYNLKEVHRAGLQAIGIKDDDRLLPYDEEPARMDPIAENMRFLTGEPVKVYPDQDHAAHIQAHMSAMTDPQMAEMIGQSPNAMRIQAAAEAHVAEHLAHQYRQEIQEQMGVELPPIGEQLPPEVENRIARLVAEAATRLKEKHADEQKQKENQAVIEDPLFQLRMREVQIKERQLDLKAKESAADDMLEMAKAISKEGVDMFRIKSENERHAIETGANLVTFGAQLDAEERRAGIEMGKEIAENFRKDTRELQKMEEQSTLKRLELQEKARDREAKRALAARKKKQT